MKEANASQLAEQQRARRIKLAIEEIEVVGRLRPGGRRLDWAHSEALPISDASMVFMLLPRRHIKRCEGIAVARTTLMLTLVGYSGDAMKLSTISAFV